MKNYIKLIESVQSNEIVLESYKDAQRLFSDVADATEVTQYIAQFKELGKRNIIKGQDKDIGKWIKAGWDEFKEFVDGNSQKTTKRAMKIQTKKESIVIYEDDSVMLVIPLSEGASCFYGKNTQWCTSATRTTNYFRRYFFEQEVVLVYALFKDGNKMALAVHDGIEAVEAFDARDNPIDPQKFFDASGVGLEDIRIAINKASPIIDKVREENTPKATMMGLANRYKGGDKTVVDDLIKAMEIYQGDEGMTTPTYIRLKNSGTLGVLMYLKEIQDSHSFENAVDIVENGGFIFDFSDMDASEYISNFDTYANPIYQRLVAEYIKSIHGDVLYDDEPIGDLSIEVIINTFEDIMEQIDDEELSNALLFASMDAYDYEASDALVRSIDEFCEEVMTDLHFTMKAGSGYGSWYNYLASEEPVEILPENIIPHIERMEEFGGDISGEYTYHLPDIYPCIDDGDLYNEVLENRLIDAGINTVNDYVTKRRQESQADN